MSLELLLCSSAHSSVVFIPSLCTGKAEVLPYRNSDMDTVLKIVVCRLCITTTITCNWLYVTFCVSTCFISITSITIYYQEWQPRRERRKNMALMGRPAALHWSLFGLGHLKPNPSGMIRYLHVIMNVYNCRSGPMFWNLFDPDLCFVFYSRCDWSSFHSSAMI